MTEQALERTQRHEWRAIEAVHPGTFALVMATGIVSLAAVQQGLDTIAWVLFWLNLATYLVVWALTIARVIQEPQRVADDLRDHLGSPGFFTIVAGTCVLGSQIQTLPHLEGAAIALWLFGLVLWIIITYAYLTAVIIRPHNPPLAEGIDGMWLLAVVATQSVSYLGVLVAPYLPGGLAGVLFLSWCLWLAGCMLYILIIALILYRLAFFDVTPAGLTAPYWINMGAAAITTLAGTRLLLSAYLWPPLAAERAFLRSFTLFFWAAGTWWIPLLLILGVWRYVCGRYNLRYDAQYWAIVFPLGMYTACTYDLARALNVPFLSALPRYSIYVALTAWVLTFSAMLATILSFARRQWRSPRRSPASAGSGERAARQPSRGDGT